MSKYFNTLSRLQAQRRSFTSARELDREAPSPRDLEAGGEDLPQVQPFARLPLAKRQAAFAHLLDHLRAVANKTDSSAVVIASVSGFEPLDSLLAGLARECQNRALGLLVGEVRQARGRRLLADHRDLSRNVPAGRGVAVNLSGRTPHAVLEEWLEGHEGRHDLAILKAPPILESADAVLLAKASAGLVLVFEPLGSTRQALRTSVERARSAGCPILGLVKIGSEDYLPRWLLRLLRNWPSSPDAKT